MALLKLSLCLFLCVTPLYAKWDSLVLRWDALGVVSKTLGSAFFTLPTTASDAESQGWTEIDSDSDYWNIWCYPNDGRVCILTDQQGNFAGLDVGLPSADFSGSPYDLSLHPMYTNVTRLGETISKTRIFLVDQDTLKNGGRSSMDELGTGLWLVSGDEFTEIPKNESEIASKTNFTKQSCIPTMGRHYYYNMSTSLDCQYFEPYFLLTDYTTGELHGVGFQGFGSPSKVKRQWFENVPYYAIKPTIPTTPDCLVDWAKEYGVISLHIYFKSSPWGIGCGGLFGTGLFSG